MKNIRLYNNTLALASIKFQGGEINQKGWNPNLKVHGEIGHLHGALFPEEGVKPNFAQIVLLDAQLDEATMHQNQVHRRMEIAKGSKAKSEIDKDTLEVLQRYLHKHNRYYTIYKALGELNQESMTNFKIILKADRTAPLKDHKGQFTLPTCDEIAIVDLNPDSHAPADFVVHLRSGGPMLISERNQNYTGLHYILLNPKADPGWHPGLTMTVNKEDEKLGKGTFGYKKSGHKAGMSACQFNRYLMMDRYSTKNPEMNLYIRGGRLSHQWFCDMHYQDMKQKLDWAAQHQKELKAEKYQGLVDALSNKDDMAEVGARIILPASVEQSPRRYNELFQGNFLFTQFPFPMERLKF